MRVRERGEFGDFWLCFLPGVPSTSSPEKASSNQGCRDAPVAASSHPNLAPVDAQIETANVGMVTDATAIQWTVIQPLKVFFKVFYDGNAHSRMLNGAQLKLGIKATG